MGRSWEGGRRMVTGRRAGGGKASWSGRKGKRMKEPTRILSHEIGLRKNKGIGDAGSTADFRML